MLFSSLLSSQKHFGLYYASAIVFDSTVCRLFMGLNIKAGLAVMDVVRASQQAVSAQSGKCTLCELSNIPANHMNSYEAEVSSRVRSLLVSNSF